MERENNIMKFIKNKWYYMFMPYQLSFERLPLFEISGNLGIDVQDGICFLEFEEERKNMIKMERHVKWNNYLLLGVYS